MDSMLLTKTTAVQNEVALSYHTLRGVYFSAVVFAAKMILSCRSATTGAKTYYMSRKNDRPFKEPGALVIDMCVGLLRGSTEAAQYSKRLL